ncbi:hypothetical protein D7294_03790 [Streptomyces hoynatensis]|uniref:Uncharacterized protein n=1 Tax=Streptomyces hoynatensis TaxID=1141874 RepID=A0A3A9ZE16_9ACTN|nr:hypothetical protein D7294_03790 [Streptomyces hoynatensis]
MRFAAAGIHLGTDRAGQALALPGPGPGGARVGVLGDTLFGRLFALRLLAVGAAVTAATRAPAAWQGLRAVAGERLRVTGGHGDWPPLPAAPPGPGGAPQALVSELPRPPAAALAAGPWRTVVHVSTAPPRSPFWTEPDAVVVLDAQLAAAAGRLLGAEAARATGALAPGEILLIRGGAGYVLRPDIAPAENAVLTPGLAPTRPRPA